jgi:hypothetical protein
MDTQQKPIKIDNTSHVQFIVFDNFSKTTPAALKFFVSGKTVQRRNCPVKATVAEFLLVCKKKVCYNNSEKYD